MNITAIRMLRALFDGPKDMPQLAGMLGRGERQIANVAGCLVEQGYAARKGAGVMLAENYKTRILRDASKIANLETLLRGCNAKVLAYVVDGDTVEGIVAGTGLSKASVCKSISDLRSIGAAVRRDDAFVIDGSKRALMLLAEMTRAEIEKRYDSAGAEIIHAGGRLVLRRVASGRTANGAPTAFTAFSSFGTEYRTAHDYFCEQEDRIDIHDVLIHAVCAAVHSGDRTGLLMCIIFYTDHKEGMDISAIRGKAREFGVLRVWSDIESYLRRNKLKDPDLFLPWSEFVDKAMLYDVPAERYLPPRPADLLFDEIGSSLRRHVTAFLIGGENMRIKGLESSTKDCGMVVATKRDYDEAVSALRRIGYRSTAPERREDARICPCCILVRPDRSRVDLFTHTIMRYLALSPSMKERADFTTYGRLRLGVLADEHVFVLKAVAGREGDMFDMESLVTGSAGAAPSRNAGAPPPTAQSRGRSRRRAFDWDLVWSEVLWQEGSNPLGRSTEAVLNCLSYLAETAGIRAPFLDRMKRHVLDGQIVSLLRGGALPTMRVVDLLAGGDVTKTMIRNRIDAMSRTRAVVKNRSGRRTRIRLSRAPRFPKPRWAVTAAHVESYLGWRFRLRRPPPGEQVSGLVRELRRAGFCTMGDLDRAVRNAIWLPQSGGPRVSPADALDRADAARVCAGIRGPDA